MMRLRPLDCLIVAVAVLAVTVAVASVAEVIVQAMGR